MILTFPAIISLLGIVFSSRTWIIQYNKLTPIQGLVVYYIILFITLLILQKLGLVVAQKSLETLPHALGTLMIIFSFFIVFDWESLYITHVTRPEIEKDIPTTYLSSEDGAIYYLWNTKLGIDPETSRWLTYVVSPFVISLIGLYVIHGEKIEITVF